MSQTKAELIDGKGNVVFDTNTLAVDATNNRVGIGTTSVSTKLHIVSNGSGGDVWVANGSGQNCLLEMAGNGNTPQTNSALYGQDASNNVYAGWARGAHPVLLGTNNTERARIDSSGRLLVGTSTTFDQSAPLQVNSSTGYSANLYVFGADNSRVTIGSARGSVASPSTLNSIDTIGGIYFRGHDGTSFKTGAQIQAQIDGITPGSDLPTRLVFSTTADGASSPTERMRINSSGNVGINNTAPDTKLDVNGAFFLRPTSETFPSDNGVGMRLRSDTNHFQIQALQWTPSVVYYDIDYLGLKHYWFVNGSEKMQLDGSGRLLVGTSSWANTSKAVFSGNSSDNLETYVDFNRGTAATATSSYIALLNFRNGGSDTCASIICQTDGACGSGDSPGRLVFSTTADGASSPTERMMIDSSGTVRIPMGGAGYQTLFRYGTNADNYIRSGVNGFTAFGDHNGGERMRIDSSGNVGIGASSVPANIKLELSHAGSTGLNIRSDGSGRRVAFSQGTGNLTSQNLVADIFGNTDNTSPLTGSLLFRTNQGNNVVEAMRINSSGNVLIGKAQINLQTNGTEIRHDGNGGTFIVTQSGNGLPCAYFNNRYGAGTQYAAQFYYGTTHVASITMTSTGGAFVNHSDHRLKENVVQIADGIERIKQLKPSRFNFIAEPNTTVDGFLAHEAQAVVPEAVTGAYNELKVWKDTEELPEGVSVGDPKLDQDGNTIPEYQGIDPSKLVPLLTAALQEAITKIETLEQRLSDAGIA